MQIVVIFLTPNKSNSPVVEDFSIYAGQYRYNNRMTTSLPAWRETYTQFLRDNGLATNAMRCMALLVACQQHPLTLNELVQEVRSFKIPRNEVYSPVVLNTLSDWDNSWETLGRLLHLEDATLERIILHYCATHQPLSNDAYHMFKGCVHGWEYPESRAAWFKLLTPEQSQDVVHTTLKADTHIRGNYLDAKQRAAVEQAMPNVGVAPPAFWQDIVAPFVDKFASAQDDSNPTAKHMLRLLPANMQSIFISRYHAKQEGMRTGLSADSFAQWVADVVEVCPNLAGPVLDNVIKKHAHLMQCPALSSNGPVIDYFLNHGMTQVSGHNELRNVLNALVHGQGSPSLRERAWIKKLGRFGAKPNDVQKMEQWTPAMAHAFDYWLATQASKYETGRGQNYIKRDLALSYKKRTGINLRSVEQFEGWRTKKSTQGTNPFAAIQANATLYDDWQQGCTMYVAAALQPPVHLASFDSTLFADDTPAQSDSNPSPH